jgi:UDP-galactopyranose mutase
MAIADYRIVVVGSGFFGSTVANLLATQHDIAVLVLEMRDHIGGNSHSRVDPRTGIEYHAYGSHIFHTPNPDVWEFVNRFSRFNNYRHRVITKHCGRPYTMPINLMTINNFYGTNFTPDEARTFIGDEIARDKIADPGNLEDKAISLIGRPLYEAFVRGYTRKQWETDLRDLPPTIITRLPVRFSYNDFYFSDPYEGIPLDGYAAIFERMLAHSRITVMTNCDYFAVRDQIASDAVVVYTGPIDRFYGYDAGRLDWRTLDLELDRIATADYQGAAVVNYPDPEFAYTRVHEFRHYHPERRYEDDQTLIMREYSRAAQPGEFGYYPVDTARNRALFDMYWNRARQEVHTVFGGRLGTYRYLDMHQAIGAAMKALPLEILPRLRRTAPL